MAAPKGLLDVLSQTQQVATTARQSAQGHEDEDDDDDDDDNDEFEPGKEKLMPATSPDYPQL